MKIDRLNDSIGLVSDGETCLTFEVKQVDDGGFLGKYNLDRTQLYLSENSTIKLGEFFVAPFGKQHNNLPLEMRETIANNPDLPELLEKQIRFLFGNGPKLYREIIEGEKVRRDWVSDAKIENWLDSWVKFNLKDYRFYLLNQIREYYYSESLFQKYIFRKSRRIGGELPVVGLEAISTNKARLATKNMKYLTGASLNRDDFDYILTGDWLAMYDEKFEAYHMLDDADPLKYPVAMSYTSNSSYAEEIYAYLHWFYGLKEWIKGANLNPKYINSFLKNSLAAKLHVIIPYSWVRSKRETLERICKENAERKAQNLPIQETYNGVTIGTVFREVMVTQVVENKLKQITSLLSGEGENQGKLFSSQSFATDAGVEQWEFKEIPLKSKEYIETIIAYDKRAVDVILTGIGLDASLSNVSKDGVISKSGADAYYNYMIYLNSLSIPEMICTYDINRAIRINFPNTDLKLGFYRPVVQRQEEITPEKRMNKNVE